MRQLPLLVLPDARGMRATDSGITLQKSIQRARTRSTRGLGAHRLGCEIPALGA